MTNKIKAKMAARPGSFCAPAMAKNILVDKTSKLPPSTSGFPKSDKLSTKPNKKVLVIPGRMSGQVTVLKLCQCEARSVCEASSSVGLMP